MPQLTPYQSAALDYKNHISLTANAGSGKTFVLANRYVEIALNENISLSKIVAITFTEKAAGELNNKIAAEIENRLEQETDPQKQKVLQRIRRQLTSANISTIHSFCINLLKEFSPEAGIDANFSPLNKQDAEELFHLTVDEFISTKLSNSAFSNSLKNVIRLVGGKNKFVQEIKTLADNRKAVDKLSEQLYSKHNDEIVEYYNKLGDEFLSIIINDEVHPLIELIEKLNNVVLENDNQNTIAIETRYLLGKYNSEKSLQEKVSYFSKIVEQVFTKSNTVKKRGYIKSSYEIDQTLIADIELRNSELSFLSSISFKRDYVETLVVYSKQIIEITNQLILEYDERKRKGGYLDFDDILLETKKLTEKNNFEELLHGKYEYVMIDEYQDTNEIQYEIFMPILDNLKKGNLFVVGDEKQSIYMFREAELEVFNRTKANISKISENGDLLLPHSFRVAPEIAHFTNELFSNLLQNPKTIYNEVGYSELICSRERSSHGKIEILVNSDAEITEAELVAKKILHEKNTVENSQWSEFAVLCRKRKAFIELEKSFSELSIPYVIAGGKGFYQRQTIFDVYNYISFLLNPGDDTSLVGLLRSPFYLLSDDLIFKISLSNGKNLFEKLSELSDKDSELDQVVQKLNKHISLSGSIRLSALIRELFTSCGYWGVVASKKNFEQEISNLFKLLGVARKFSFQSFKTLFDFKLFLNEAISSFDDEGQAQIADSSNAVKIMTLHQAKGLEFKNVFLYKCNEKTRDETVKAKSLEIDKNWGVLTKVPVNESYFQNYATPFVVDIFNYIQNKKQIAEAKRLFYVGITRAIDNLFLAGTVIENKIEKNSFFDFTLSGLKTDLSRDEIVIQSGLKFMADSSKDFVISESEITTKIPIINSIEAIELPESENKNITAYSKFNLSQIKDHEKNEIVSATKIAIYTQCPTKYYLTYELGYTELFKLTKSFTNDYEFKYAEDESLNIFADIRGQIVHSLLENELELDQLDGKLEKLVDKYQNRIGSRRDDFKKLIIDELTHYFESETFLKIKKQKDFRNEFEIYAKESDYYVYGIIDKLIYDDNQLRIVDYKTDNVTEDKLKLKSEHYLPQLKFYAYTLSKLYSNVDKIVAQLVFIKLPSQIVEFSFERNEIKKYGREIENIVKKIRRGEFTKNLDHCSKCHFSLKGKCVFQS